MVNLVQRNMHCSKRKKHRLPGLSEGVIMIKNGVEVTQELSDGRFNEQWLIGPV